MKRIQRHPEKFDVIGLFNRMGITEGYSLHDEASERQFVDGVAESLKQSKANPMLVHGLHVQSMFGYVAACLGKCAAVKEEDAGELYVEDTDVRPPDYRIVLDNGDEWFVEVKNCHEQGPTAQYTAKDTYVRALTNYAGLFNRPLQLAIYWSRWNVWTLIPVDRLNVYGDRHSITMQQAVKISEMRMLGDLMIGTTPPLMLRLSPDPNELPSIDETGQAEFRIGNADFYCGGIRIEDKFEQRLAFYFTMFGDWPVGEPEARIENGELLSIDFVSAPEQTIPGQGFELLGSLSGAISRYYSYLTVSDQGVARLTPSQEPESLEVLVPLDYRGKHLPLWRFNMQPNYEPE